MPKPELKPIAETEIDLVAKGLRSGQTWRLWRGKFESTPPFPIGPDALFVAYYASAELGCFRALGWPMPANILDLFTEFRDRTNGLTTPAGSGLVGALTYFGLDSVGAIEKDEMRARILRGACSERDEEILNYCAGDTEALEGLLLAMLPPRSNRGIDLPRALLRGRYMAAAAVMGVERGTDRHHYFGALAETLDGYSRRFNCRYRHGLRSL
jgi:DNA polymerase I